MYTTLPFTTVVANTKMEIKTNKNEWRKTNERNNTMTAHYHHHPYTFCTRVTLTNATV